jgi:ribonuclease HI
VILSVYTDGSSTGRADGPGGWAFVITTGSTFLASQYGGILPATNNQMELMAAIKGLEAVQTHLRNEDRVELVSDSRYVLGTASGQFNGTKNTSLCGALRGLAKSLPLRFRWVAGHSGDLFNERCDVLAKKGKADVLRQFG